jgi:hypothetical protein
MDGVSGAYGSTFSAMFATLLCVNPEGTWTRRKYLEHTLGTYARNEQAKHTMEQTRSIPRGRHLF